MCELTRKCCLVQLNLEMSKNPTQRQSFVYFSLSLSCSLVAIEFSIKKFFNKFPRITIRNALRTLADCCTWHFAIYSIYERLLSIFLFFVCCCFVANWLLYMETKKEEKKNKKPYKKNRLRASLEEKKKYRKNYFVWEWVCFEAKKINNKNDDKLCVYV